MALAGCLAATAAAQVSDQGLLNPDPQDWLMYSGRTTRTGIRRCGS
jgi:hypothetical protein